MANFASIKLTNITDFAKKSENRSRRKRIQYLFRAGSFVRLEIRRLIGRNRKKVSAPNSPPNDHNAYRKTVVFDVDFADESVEIGMIKSNRRKDGLKSSQLTMDLLEFGGSAKYKGKTVYIKPRPHIEIAGENILGFKNASGLRFKKSTEKLAEDWYK